MFIVSYHLEHSEYELSDIIQFICGSKTIPPIGIPKFSLEFKHGCDKSQSGKDCCCLPSANTCSSTLVLPTHTNCLQQMTDSFILAIGATRKYGFGLG